MSCAFVTMRASTLVALVVSTMAIFGMVAAQDPTNQLTAVSVAEIPSNRAATALRAGFTKTTTNHEGDATITAGSFASVKDRRAKDEATGKAFATASGQDGILVAVASTGATLEPLDARGDAVADDRQSLADQGNAKTRTNAFVVRNGVRLP